MSTSYTHLTIDEREMLLIFCERGLGVREIARQLGRSASSISRELNRNCGEHGRYSAHAAQQAYQERRRRCVRKRKLDVPERRELVEAKLLLYWSPEQIDGRLKREKSKLCVSYSTIYRAIHSKELNVPNNCLRRGGRNPSPHDQETRGRLHGHKTIHQRPNGANNRSRFGHWEGDTMQGARGKGAASTFVDRKSDFLVGELMQDRKSKTLNAAMREAFRGFPPSLLRSFTVDHGNEFFGYAEIEEDLGTKVFFADPYAPWQRGLNENTNGLLRQYFPKKCDFLKVTPEQFRSVIDAINDRPRKRLGFRSPREVFPVSKVLHFT